MIYLKHCITGSLVVGRVIADDPGDQCSIAGRAIPKIFKKWYLVPPYLILNKARIKGKVEQSREKSSDLPDTSV